MVELRWLRKPIKTCGSEKCVEPGCDGEIKILQLRQTFEQRDESGILHVMSEWKNVPTEESK